MARFLALDWDQNQLHLIAATVKGNAVQVQKALVWQETRIPNPAEAEALGQVLRDRMRSAGISPAPVLACLGRDRVIVKEVRFPPVPAHEEPAVVRFQAVKELTDSPEDAVIDYITLGVHTGGDTKAAALVIRREQLQTYQTLCQAAGLKLAALTPRTVGIAACLRKVMGTTVVTPAPEPANATIAVVVVHERTAEMCVLKGSNFLLTRSLPAGPNLASDVRRTLSVHAGQSPQFPVAAVYVAGREATELRQRLTELSEIPVHTFDPFAGSSAADLPQGNRGTFAGAMGMLFAQGEGQLPINFVAPRQPRAPETGNFRFFIRVAAACFLGFVAIMLLGMVVQASYERENADLKERLAKKEQELKNTKVNAIRLKAIDDWDNVVVLDEYYDVTKKIDLKVMKVTAFKMEPVARKPGSSMTGKATIQGEMIGKSSAATVAGQLVKRYEAERDYYDPQVPDIDSKKGTFSLVVYVARRSPEEHVATLSPSELKAPVKGGKGPGKAKGKMPAPKEAKGKGKMKAKGKKGG